MKTLKEGLLDMFKSRKQFVALQGAVADEYERLLAENPKRFRDGKSVLRAVESFALDMYKKTITVEGAISFGQWWRDFENAHARMLDATIFKN